MKHFIEQRLYKKFFQLIFEKKLKFLKKNFQKRPTKKIFEKSSRYHLCNHEDNVRKGTRKAPKSC